VFHWRNSLRTKIVAWSFVPTAIILAAVAFFTFRSYQQVTEQLVIDRNRELVRLSASRLTTEMARFADLLEAETRHHMINGGDPAMQQLGLQDASNRLAIFDGGVVILDATGHVSASQPYRPDIAEEDWSDREVFRDLLQSPLPAYSDVTPDGPDGAEVIAVAVPIVNPENQFMGAMVGMFRVDAQTVSAFYGSLAKLRLARNGSAYLIDGSDVIVYHTDVDRIGSLRSTTGSRITLSGETNALRTQNAQGEEVVASYAPVPGTSWHLITEESWASLIGTALGYRRFLLILLALGLLIPAVVVAVGVRRITTPIENLIDVAKEIASGNFQRELVPRSNDELDELAEQFNRMSKQLQESYSNLEQRVADRTRELEALNTIIQTAGRSLDLTELLDTTLQKVLEVLSFEMGTITLRDVSSGDLRLACARGLPEPLGEEIVQGKIATTVAQSGAPVFIGDLPEEMPTHKVAIERGVRAIASIPLAVKGEVLGVLTIASRESRQFEERDTALLTSIGNQIGVAVENARLYEQAHQIAMLEERQRIARELHDVVSQTLFSASVMAEVLPRLWARDESEGQRRLTELRELTRGAQAEMRTLLLELRPDTLVETSMKDLLRQLAEAIIGRARLPVEVRIEGDCPLPDDVKIAMYRITQEALNNISKHAGATEVSIAFNCGPDRITLDIQDNGRGFDPGEARAGRMGLSTMRERAREIGADLSLRSAVGEGTTIHVDWTRPPGEG
jgi:nitrate/nitrite-specific signal transduction histidine kinase